jgi:2-succinyl-5-enolpyruvyl-6-hydroxy-3-cyclohexene-1-carboxylate synthase
MNKQLAQDILDQLAKVGVKELSICPGGRNAPFVPLLRDSKRFECYYCYEERSAAFFALGKAKIKERPAAVITTSGTAAGELLPATMEAYYSGVPLILITADRPRRFRGTAAPQTAEQVGIFGIYAPYSQDIAESEKCDFNYWNKASPAHINVCFEEPLL